MSSTNRRANVSPLTVELTPPLSDIENYPELTSLRFKSPDGGQHTLCATDW